MLSAEQHRRILQRLGNKLARLREKESEVLAEIRLAVQAAHHDGVPETHIAKHAGIDRMTVRKHLGK